MIFFGKSHCIIVGQTRVSSIPDHTIAKYHAELAKDAERQADDRVIVQKFQTLEVEG